MALHDIQENIILEVAEDTGGWYIDVFNEDLTKDDLHEIAAYLISRADELPEA